MRSGWTLARRLQASLAAFSLLLVVAGGVLVVALRQADRALSQQTKRILPARTVASQLLTALVSQETALRGYAITHRAAYLRPYHVGVAQESALRARLGALIPAAGPARLDLLTVDAAITAWRDEYATLRLRDVLNGSATTTIGFGKQLFDRVRQTSYALDAELGREARAAQRRADHDRGLVIVTFLAMTVLVAIALIGLQRALRRSVLDPLRALGRQVATVSTGTHGREIQPSGPPDIREMGVGVESMRLELVGALADVEARTRDLERRAAELARSNADLEQFAYVASHDLQEPLRKVASFCQLLEQRYGGQLDERGEQYIAFAVDGAKRMQRLITDLLTFSRVGRTSEGFAPVDLAATVARAWSGLEARVAETGAQLETAGLDQRVDGDASLLQMLFANLLGNSIKYSRAGTTPKVRVSTEVDGDAVVVNVADNGIGIPAEYADKVFVIFQRLHGRDEYEGTGIGLALCKKIVEFHGGSIELRPSPLGGTCVSFTLRPEETSAHD
ncbi:MAG: CHASE3 domain-containing protein [Frankiaceae bacterium]|nr:CHASE3 domain-containing protein [Frankiaceae bacterium]